MDNGLRETLRMRTETANLTDRQYNLALGLSLTYGFVMSAILAVTTKEMMTDLCGRVFMDAGRMNYLEPHWTGEVQLEAANNSVHGGVFVGEGRYWDSFIEYCNANALNILKQELRKQGLNVR